MRLAGRLMWVVGGGWGVIMGFRVFFVGVFGVLGFGGMHVTRKGCSGGV